MVPSQGFATIGWLAWYPYCLDKRLRSVTNSRSHRPYGSWSANAQRLLSGSRITIAATLSPVSGLTKVNFFVAQGLVSSSVVAAFEVPSVAGADVGGTKRGRVSDGIAATGWGEEDTAVP